MHTLRVHYRIIMIIYTVQIKTSKSIRKFDSFDNYLDASDCAIDLVRNFQLEPDTEIKLSTKELV